MAGSIFCISQENTTRSSCSHCSYPSSVGLGGVGFPDKWPRSDFDFPPMATRIIRDLKRSFGCLV
ncbi:hypothetical protein HanRHA438_Chr01g0009291 [Helianthus annuus]|nr:hypothetical protein HanIR_Chr01g0010011 [Helianthus annuus]KAJ0946916.1 hypothetical protein HanRHA438_Chr01g0009291 [Helianthus annuus]